MLKVNPLMLYVEIKKKYSQTFVLMFYFVETDSETFSTVASFLPPHISYMAANKFARPFHMNI